MTINYLILVAGLFFGTLTLHASINASKNNVKHSSQGRALIHLVSTLSLYALTAWGIISNSTACCYRVKLGKILSGNTKNRPMKN